MAMQHANQRREALIAPEHNETDTTADLYMSQISGSWLSLKAFPPKLKVRLGIGCLGMNRL
jgi:hypothetical protein